MGSTCPQPHGSPNETGGMSPGLATGTHRPWRTCLGALPLEEGDTALSVLLVYLLQDSGTNDTIMRIWLIFKVERERRFENLSLTHTLRFMHVESALLGVKSGGENEDGFGGMREDVPTHTRRVNTPGLSPSTARGQIDP